MKSMPRPNSGLRRTLKHLMRPGKNVSQQEVSTVSEQLWSTLVKQDDSLTCLCFSEIMKTHDDGLFSVEFMSNHRPRGCVKASGEG